MAKPRDNRQKDLLRPALEEIVDLGHPLVRLAREIDWGFLDSRFAGVCASGAGQPPLPTRLVAGLFGSPKPRRGYHRAVTPVVAAEICRRIASGQTLLAVCRDADMPHHDAIYDEMRRSPSFADAIARARAESAHGLAMQVLEIADAAGPHDNPQLVKNRCDQRRWLAGT